MTNEQIRNESLRWKDYVVDCRRKIHAMAEISGTEVRTSAFIAREMEDSGLEVEKLVKTGLIGTLDTGKPGPCIALRADIDALPMPEEPDNLKGPRVCISDRPAETCHACGHDAHSAMLLGAMKALTANKDSLIGKIYFCFEEGEENGGGIQAMLDALEKRRIDTCWAIHVYANLESGKICMDAGPRMAGAAGVRFRVVGKGGHGSRPDLAANPVFCAASIMTNLATAWVNQIAAGETVTLGITTIQGGQTSNIIPDSARVEGSLRFFNRAEGEKAVGILRKVAVNTAEMNRCTISFDEERNQVVCSPVINDAHCSGLAKAKMKELLPEGAVVSCEPWYASESYNRWVARYPGVLAHLGIANPDYGSGAAHHNSFFDVDEGVMPMGMISTLGYVMAVQEEWKQETTN